jgi:hypothetical protein
MRTGIAVLALVLTLMFLKSSRAQSSAPEQARGTAEHVHVVNSFRFEVAASMERVAPLFAPEAERSWAGEHWKPIFLYPQPGRDVQGAVWTIKHGPFNSVWVNTLFDLPGGRMQYVAITGEHFVMTVDVRVTAMASSRTAVEVTYTRTALDPSANEDVRALGESDRTSAPEWQKGIESALGLAKK